MRAGHEHPAEGRGKPVGKDAAAEAKLRSLNGAAFDRAYLQAAVSDHQQAIAAGWETVVLHLLRGRAQRLRRARPAAA